MKIKEECALFGTAHQYNAPYCVSLALFAQQHRGEEGSGIATLSGETIECIKGLGKVDDVYKDNRLDPFSSCVHAIGHNRYSVTGGNTLNNVQPFSGLTKEGTPFALGHNGNLTNSLELRQELSAKGVGFKTSVDTEVIVKLIENSDAPLFEDKIVGALSRLKGSYCLLILTPQRLYGIRDPYGVRPLVLGENNGAFAFASESCAFDLLSFSIIRQVERGEIVSIPLENGVTKENLRSRFVNVIPEQSNKCVFELIYFSRPDSVVFGESVYEFRKRIGKKLAEKAPVEADFVLPIPDSGVYSALGYAQASGIPYEQATIRNHYAGRSFIQPSQSMRDILVRLKHNPVTSVLKGKRVVLVDDSIVRGTTILHHIQSLKRAGVREIHLRIASPPIAHPCYYGIDFPSREELIINQMSQEEIRKRLDIDTLHYLSMNDLKEVSGDGGFCFSCFTGHYAIYSPKEGKKDILDENANLQSFSRHSSPIRL